MASQEHIQTFGTTCRFLETPLMSVSMENGKKSTLILLVFFSRSLCIKSIEVSLFENTYFVNKLYIVKYVFLHRHFSYTLNFLVQLRKKKKDYLFSNDIKSQNLII